jgi:hypothetical protein
LIGGLPVKNYEAEVRFDESESGTAISWDISFQPRIPFTGALLARVMKSGLQDVLDRLARYQF